MMISRKILYVSGLLAVSASAFAVSPAIVHALIVSDSTTDITVRSSVTTQTTSTTNDTDTQKTESSRSRANSDAVDSAVRSIQLKAEKDVANERKTRAKLDDDSREQLCNGRKSSIEDKVAVFSKSAEDHLVRFDTVYSNLDAYITAHSITSVNLTAAKSAQAAATDKAATLQTVVGDATVDCSNSTDVAAWLTQVRAAASDARDALKTYRTELKKVVVALQQVNSAKTTTTTTGQE